MIVNIHDLITKNNNSFVVFLKEQLISIHNQIFFYTNDRQ